MPLYDLFIAASGAAQRVLALVIWGCVYCFLIYGPPVAALLLYQIGTKVSIR
jgi:hypothetical protein